MVVNEESFAISMETCQILWQYSVRVLAHLHKKGGEMVIHTKILCPKCGECNVYLVKAYTPRGREYVLYCTCCGKFLKRLTEEEREEVNRGMF